jgi:hypothetical protein
VCDRLLRRSRDFFRPTAMNCAAQTGGAGVVTDWREEGCQRKEDSVCLSRRSDVTGSALAPQLLMLWVQLIFCFWSPLILRLALRKSTEWRGTGVARMTISIGWAAQSQGPPCSVDLWHSTLPFNEPKMWCDATIFFVVGGTFF